MNLLLDTCTFLWIITGDEKLSNTAERVYLEEDNEVFLSTVSEWEIALKYSIGRLELPTSPQIFIPEQREKHGIQVLPLDEISSLNIGNLEKIHKDPFDRMLVSQSIINGYPIITPDELVRRYPIHTIW
jgi:PIN domain nuclease of toxin-antitoxin system